MAAKVEKIVAFIPVRGGSKSIPLKNIRLLAGKPMVQWTLEAGCACEAIQKVYVSTDSDIIKDTIERMNLPKVNVINRSAETASDTASSESALLEFSEKYAFENVVFIQATSPLLTVNDLTEALKKYSEIKCDSLLSVVRQKRFIWREEDNYVNPVNYNPLNRPRRQEFEGFLVENGAFYITSREQLLKSKCRISGNVGYYEMPEESYYEVDEPSDWVIIEELIKQKKFDLSNVRQIAKNIKILATDVDGVLTDAGMYYSEHGDELKKFNTKDGMGIALLHKAGIRTCIITGENIELVKRRANKLHVDEVYMGVDNKLEVLHQIVKKYGVGLDEIAYIGDDINDLQVISSVGLGCCVSDAIELVKKVSKVITRSAGGEGALREVAELIITSKNNKSIY